MRLNRRLLVSVPEQQQPVHSTITALYQEHTTQQILYILYSFDDAPYVDI